MTPDDFLDEPEILAIRALEFGRWVTDRCALVGDCWLWRCSVNNYGYAQMNTARYGRGMPHRMLFEQLRGEPLNAKSQRLQNRCGSRHCCNPKHWHVVAAGKVIADQYRKHQRGSAERIRASALRAHSARASRVGSFEKAAQARDMRAAGSTSQQIALHFGISKTTAKRWASGRAWAPPSMFAGLGRR